MGFIPFSLLQHFKQLAERDSTTWDASVCFYFSCNKPLPFTTKATPSFSKFQLYQPFTYELHVREAILFFRPATCRASVNHKDI